MGLLSIFLKGNDTQKSNDPFDGLMIKVCSGKFSQRYIKFSNSQYDKRKKAEMRHGHESRTVTLTKDFQICKYPTTQKQWKVIMGEGFNMSENRGDDLPVTNVSYEDIMQFIKKLNKLTGKKYRLPTEAEWQWAAMGANKDNDQGQYAGCKEAKDIPKYAWCENNSDDKTHPVGKKKPNELGLYDMMGNVWEVCQDKCDEPDSPAFSMHKTFVSGSDVIDPIEKSGAFHVTKGGCCYNRLLKPNEENYYYWLARFEVGYAGVIKSVSSVTGFRIVLD